MVYFWRKGTDGVKKNNQSYWRGPARVILTSPPDAIWITCRGYVIKASPEHLRSATEEETFTLSQWVEDIAHTRDEIQREPRQGYIDLTDTSIPGELRQVVAEQLGDQPEGEEVQLEPKHRLLHKTKPEIVEGRQDDEWRYNPATGELVRIHYQPPRRLFDPREAARDCQVEIVIELVNIDTPSYKTVRTVPTGRSSMAAGEKDYISRRTISAMDRAYQIYS